LALCISDCAAETDYGDMIRALRKAVHLLRKKVFSISYKEFVQKIPQLNGLGFLTALSGYSDITSRSKR
jgi:hypothetical protein